MQHHFRISLEEAEDYSKCFRKLRDLDFVLVLDHPQRFEYGRKATDEEKNYYLAVTQKTTFLGAIKYRKEEQRAHRLMQEKIEIEQKKQKAREEYE